MITWPDKLASYRFNPTEVERITGITHGQQRQWRVRYLDFRQINFVQSEALKHGRWGWEGVQLLALFDRALRDLGSGDMARRVLMLDPEPGIIRDELGIFYSDQREPETGDLFIAGDLSRGDAATFATTGADGLRYFLKPHLPHTSATPRPYIINFSAFQSDLFDRAAASIGVALEPQA